MSFESDNDSFLYSKLLEIMKKYPVQDILVDCYINNVIDNKKKVLAHLYILIDRYINEPTRNDIIKKNAKRWIKNIIMKSRESLITETKKFIETEFSYYNIKNISYAYTKEELEEYLYYVNAEWEQESAEDTKIIIQKVPK